MRGFVRKSVKALKLAVIWVRRILFAPNHFGVSFFTRIRFSFLGFVADQCVLYDLRGGRWRDYLSEFDWYCSRWIDEPFDAMLNNKVACTHLLSPYVLVPEVIAVKTQGEIVLCDGTGKARSPQDAVDAARRRGSVFMKPISAGKGKGVHRLDALSDGRFLLDGRETGGDALAKAFSEEDGWFLCEAVRQSAYLDELYDGSANTVRLITFRDPDSGSCKVFFAVQRIGTSATGPVDNGSRGGLVARIDLATGVLGEARCLHSLERHSIHPDTGHPIEGLRIPDWDDMKRCSLRLACQFPYIRFIAWDLLATDEGICVIEANASSGVNIIQLWGPQRNGELGEYYRSRGVLR